MEETIDLREYFFILKKKLWIIVTSALVCGLISGLVSFFALTPIYQANTSLIVNKEVGNKVTEMTTTDDLNYVQKLAITYGEIIKSRAVITPTIEKLDLNMTYEELASAVSVTNVSDTQIIKISVQHENPKVAMKICNTIPSIFSEEVQRIVTEQYELAKTLLEENRDMLDTISHKLLEMETLDEKEFVELMEQVKNSRRDA